MRLKCAQVGSRGDDEGNDEKVTAQYRVDYLMRVRVGGNQCIELAVMLITRLNAEAHKEFCC